MYLLFVPLCGWLNNWLKDSSPQNENSVINYSPSCRSKPVRPSFIFRTQIKIFLMESGYYHDQRTET